jgi:hypothetical protein
MPTIPYYKVTTNAEGVITKVESDTNLPLPSEVRNRWCFGLPLTKESGDLMTDEDILDFLEGAIRRTERELGIYLKPTVIVANPEERALIKGTDYDKEEPPYDYDAKAWMNYGFLQLRERPVHRVINFQLVLPNGNIIMDFKTRTDWIKLYKESGQIHLVPYAGDPTLFALMGGSSSGYPFVTGMINRNLPQMIYVDYETGYPANEIPKDIRNVIAKMASVDILGIAGDAILAGVASQSTSIDGLSESMSTTASATNATYGARILQYKDEIEAFFDPKKGAVRTSERGITLSGF